MEMNVYVMCVHVRKIDYLNSWSLKISSAQKMANGGDVIICIWQSILGTRH